MMYDGGSSEGIPLVAVLLDILVDILVVIVVVIAVVRDSKALLQLSNGTCCTYPLISFLPMFQRR